MKFVYTVCKGCALLTCTWTLSINAQIAYQPATISAGTGGENNFQVIDIEFCSNFRILMGAHRKNECKMVSPSGINSHAFSIINVYEHDKPDTVGTQSWIYSKDCVIISW